MKTKRSAWLGLVSATAAVLLPGCSTQTPPAAQAPVAALGSSSSGSAAVHDPAAVAALLAQIAEGNAAANTLSADFSYTVTSTRRQQRVTGKVRLMKPNYARITFDSIAEPAFPNVVASDGTRLYTFTPANYRSRSTFVPPAPVADSAGASDPAARATPPQPVGISPYFVAGPFDPVAAARAASGLTAAGGTLASSRVQRDGRDIRLWDGILVQSFFSPQSALRYLYARDPSEYIVEAPQTIDGTSYNVLYHRFAEGQIEGGDPSVFHQRLYVAADGIIHRYVLEFTADNKPGTQTMQLANIKLNEPMTAASFAFEPPVKAVAQTR